MTGDTRATTFVTGADGFIGLELVKVLVARGHQVFGLAQCAQAAQRVRRAGAVPVMGDLLEPGRWQDEVAADWYGATARVQSPRTSRGPTPGRSSPGRRHAGRRRVREHSPARYGLRLPVPHAGRWTPASSRSPS